MIDSCIAVAFTSRGSNRTLTIKSHETVVDVVMCVWNTWTDVFLNKKALRREGCALMK